MNAKRQAKKKTFIMPKIKVTTTINVKGSLWLTAGLFC